MEINEAKSKFIESWGTLGTNWGINRTMAQIHALLLISPEALSAEELMEQLNISRGNANMNTRTLIAWGIVHKVLKPGERMEFFAAEKDMWHVALKIMRERRKRELEPMRDALMQLQKIDGKHSPEKQEFQKIIKEIDTLADRADTLLHKMERVDENWFFSKILKLFK